MAYSSNFDLVIDNITKSHGIISNEEEKIIVDYCKKNYINFNKLICHTMQRTIDTNTIAYMHSICKKNGYSVVCVSGRNTYMLYVMIDDENIRCKYDGSKWTTWNIKY